MFTIFRSRRIRSATDCALLLAIPLNRAEYDTAWQRGTDFLQAYGAACDVTDPDRLWRIYEHYAGLCSAAVDVAEAYGVAVFRGATLKALADATGRFATVTIVAHSREPGIETRDIAAFDRLHASLQEIAAALGVTPPLIRVDEPARLAAWLDTALGSRESGSPERVADTRAAAWRAHRQQERWLRRRAIEQLCPGGLSGGPAVELEDGLWPVPAIDAALPLQFQTLDLTVCDSVLLADVLRARRTDGIILANAHPTTPDFRLALYRETVRLMVRHGSSYHEAGIRLRRSLRGRPSPSVPKIAPAN